ncbi:MAG: hypothetical protein O2894_12650, partial [Planctomycetota bacterium]|nr:hypothetical protein [Planctomycetota bacterium]
MTVRDDFHELLCADLALMEGLADVRQVAAALLGYWERRDRTTETLAQRLAALAGLTPSDVAGLEARVAALVAEASGDARLAL